MTLIPLISSIFTAPERTAVPAGTVLRRDSYDPGAGHRPVAATLAIGVPVALVVAAALSPTIGAAGSPLGRIIMPALP